MPDTDAGFDKMHRETAAMDSARYYLDGTTPTYQKEAHKSNDRATVDRPPSLLSTLLVEGSMSVYSVPERFRPGLEQLRDLPKGEATRLIASLEGAKPTWNPEQLADRVAETSGLGRPAVLEIVTSVVAASGGRQGSDMSVDAFVEDVLDSGGISLTKSQRQTMKTRLTSLLRLPAVRISYKALDLLGSDSRVFLDARIVSDIRPIFGDDVALRPEAAMILHGLRIDFRGSNGSDSFEVTLDPSDLVRLKGILERAAAKEKSLVSYVKSTDVSYIDVERS